MFGRLVAAIGMIALVLGCTSPVVPTLPPDATPTPAPAPTTPPPTSSPAPTSSAGPTPSAAPTSSISATASPTTEPTPPPSTTGGPIPTPGPLSGDDISRHLDALMQIATDNNGIRAAGTKGYVESAGYVAHELAGLGFRVDDKPFEFTFFDEAAPVTLIVGDQTWTGGEWLHSMLYGGGGNVAGVLEAVKLTPDGRVIDTGGCDPADWSDFVAGHIAVVESAPCLRRDQVLNAQNAGAIGLVSLYPNSEANQTRRPTLIDPGVVTIPAIVAGGEPSSAILAALAAGGSAQMDVQITTSLQTNDNVVAELPGATDDVVMVGAHLDSVLDGPGINDNGSGVATVLAIARAVTAGPPHRDTIRFGFWGAEEYGDLGSAAYVRGLSPDETKRIVAYLNLDMVGSPNPGRFVYGDAGAPAGSGELVQQLLDALSAAGKPGLTIDVGGSSDHFNFGQAGIPIAGVFSGLGPLTSNDVSFFGGQVGVAADACYHLSCDVRTNVSMDSALTLGGAVWSVVQDLAY